MSSVCRATGEADEHAVDLLAIACVQAWARWLPGFAGSSVPFLLDTSSGVLRASSVSDDEITVALPAALARRRPGAGGVPRARSSPARSLGGRRVRFVTGDGHGT